MLRVFDIESDLRLPALTLHLSPNQISKDISPNPIPKPNFAKPFPGGEPNRAPITLQQMSPIAVTVISGHFLAPAPPISDSSNHNQRNQNSNPNRNRRPKSRLQGIKRPHRPINKRAKRNQSNKNRHHKLTRRKN